MPPAASAPPPDDLRQRTAGTARLNAWSILIVAGIATLWSTVGGDYGSTAFGAALCAAAGAELAGSRRVLADPAAARPLLVGGELGVLVLIAGYSVWRLVAFDFDAEMAELPTEAREALYSLVGGDDEMLRHTFTLTNRLTYSCLLLVTLLYQGGMALFYRRRVAAMLAP